MRVGVLDEQGEVSMLEDTPLSVQILLAALNLFGPIHNKAFAKDIEFITYRFCPHAGAFATIQHVKWYGPGQFPIITTELTGALKTLVQRLPENCECTWYLGAGWKLSA